jgi:hypothetical protein
MYLLIDALFKVDLCHLHLDPMQLETISKLYHQNENYHATFTDSPSSQILAQSQLQSQNLDIKNLGDLGNRWSKRWSTVEKCYKRDIERVLLQW